LRISSGMNSVLPAIKLNNHPRVRTEEINNKAVDRNLAAKLPSGETAVPEAKPEDALGICLIPAKASRCLGACL
jgi:hypothetical protein